MMYQIIHPCTSKDGHNFLLRDELDGTKYRFICNRCLLIQDVKVRRLEDIMEWDESPVQPEPETEL